MESNTKKVQPLKRCQVGTKKRFTDEEVWAIRKAVMDGQTMKSLCREYDVSPPTIASAVYGTGTYKGV